MRTLRARVIRDGMVIPLHLSCPGATLAKAVAQPTEAYAAQHVKCVKSEARWWYSHANGGYAKGWLKDKGS